MHKMRGLRKKLSRRIGAAAAPRREAANRQYSKTNLLRRSTFSLLPTLNSLCTVRPEGRNGGVYVFVNDDCFRWDSGKPRAAGGAPGPRNHRTFSLLQRICSAIPFFRPFLRYAPILSPKIIQPPRYCSFGARKLYPKSDPAGRRL